MTDTKVPTLTAADRCDRCGAQAHLRATMPSGLPLLFCAHHGTENVNPLIAKGAVILDERMLVPA